MLVLTRKIGEAIIIGDNIEITLLEQKGDQIRVGINAPRDITILRKEIYQAVKDENKAAVTPSHSNLENIAEIIKKSK